MNLVSEESQCFVSGNIEIVGKQDSPFSSGPVLSVKLDRPKIFHELQVNVTPFCAMRFILVFGVTNAWSLERRLKNYCIF